jgi:hypothetical protein
MTTAFLYDGHRCQIEESEHDVPRDTTLSSGMTVTVSIMQGTSSEKVPACARDICRKVRPASSERHPEVDFVPGVYHFEAFDTYPPRSKFGGLAVALMRPEQGVLDRCAFISARKGSSERRLD